MFQSDGQPRQLVLALLLVLAAGGGCGRGDTRADSPSARGASSVPAADDTSRAALLREAESLYVYDRDERKPLTRTDPDFKGPVVEDKALPDVRISTARLKDPRRHPRYRIIARINSSAPYDGLGLGKGFNYVWRNSWDSAQAGTWVTKIIPSDASKPDHVLTRDSRDIPYSHGDAREPRLVRIKVHSVALGLCIDDPRCGGHCGYY